MTIKPTPGPWGYAPTGHIMADGYSQPFAIAQDGERNLIAGCFGDVRGGRETAEANARLIAAAPDLLEALKLARECIAYCRRAHKDAQPGTGFPVETILDAAVAKAEA